VRDTPRVDVAAHYRHLIALGREEFLAAAAPAAFVRYPSRMLVGLHSADRTLGMQSGERTVTLDETVDLPTPGSHLQEVELELFPLVKKPGASFPDRITIGRTHNNDIAIIDHSVSRFHAYVRQVGAGWVVADAGSKNGSWLRGAALEARREQPLSSKVILRLGEVDLTFYVANDLYEALGGS
jgi:FHA domain-containing protein